MIFGLEVTVPIVIAVGLVLFALVLFQVLAGMRVIKLGRKHRVVHKWTALTILGLAVVHGFLGVVLGFGLRIF